MTRPSLKSRFGEQIRAFVGYKNSLGFPYNESIRILGRFDDFCVERFPEKDCLDCETRHGLFLFCRKQRSTFAVT